MIEKGKYIVLEGGEYVGKSTQTAKLAASLRALIVREPGTTIIGEGIRSLLLNNQIEKTPETEVLLFAAARAELIRSEVSPAIDKGRHVVSDRSWISSAAYQSTRGVALADIEEINTFAISSYMNPDLVFLLDADPAVLVDRSGSKLLQDYYESLDKTFHNKVRENFLSIGERIGAIVIDATQDVDVVANLIQESVHQKLGL